MRVRARVALPSGAEVELSPGDMIGRLAHAALSIADPSVSEAHALVSLRAGRLMLLALRRRFEVDGQSRDEVVLEPGLEIGLGASVRLLVLEVALPESVLGVRLPGLPAIPLPPVISLFAERLPRTKLGYDARADIVLFTDGPRFFASTPGDPAREVSVGAVLEARDTRFELVAVPIRDVEALDTAVETARAPCMWTLNFDIVKVLRGGEELLSLTGHTARVVSELAPHDQPVPWESIARAIWRDDADVHTLRRRWDMALGRMRHKLREAHLPTDIVRVDGRGNVELQLPARHRLEDRS